jgi:tetratricopeptide (TPR) repeat protein
VYDFKFMKKQLILLALLISFSFTWAQNERMDSLATALKRVKNDIDKAQTLNAIADEYKNLDPQKTLDFAQQALRLSKKIKHKVAEGNAYLNIGNANIILGSYTIALQNCTSAALLFENETNSNPKQVTDIKKGLAKAYGSIGIIFSEQSNYTKALHFYLKSVKIYESLNDQAKCASIYNNIGIVFKSQSSDFKALEYFVKAQKIKEKLNDPTIGITITNIANCYLKQKNFDKAFDYYLQAKKSFDKFPNPRGLGEWYNNFGLLYKATNNPDKAIENWNLAIETFKTIEDKFGVADTYLHLGQLYLEQNQPLKAIEMAQKALQLSTELRILEQQMVCEKLLSDCYSKQNNTALALSHYKLYNKAKDSLVNEENTRKSVEAEMNFEFEKREAIHKKELENKELLLQEESKRSKLQLFFALLFGLLLFGIGFLIYNRIQLKKTLVLQKELAEYEQKALHLQMNPHFVFNCLGSISSFIVNNGNESAIKYLAKFSKLMRLTLEYSKESLIPIDKEIEGLQNYLELEQLRFNNKFSFSIDKSNAIEDDMAIPPLLLQPFVENAIIHGVIPKKELGTIAIHFFIEKEHLVCTVEDNGIGFQQSQLNKEKTVVIHKSMALDITKKRLQMIESTTNQKANFTIEETVKENQIQGTKVVLHLPIQYLN